MKRWTWFAFVAMGVGESSAASTCRDARGDAWNLLSDMASSTPIFMQGAVNSICKKAALAASKQLPATCTRTPKHLRDSADGGCAATFAALSSAATAGDCLCLGILAFADAAEQVRAMHADAPTSTVQGSSAPLVALACGLALVGASWRRAQTRPAFL